MIAHAPAQPALCRGGDLRGSFALVPMSAGAGNVVYRLTLTKVTAGQCFVSGIPQLRLRRADGTPLPTRATAAHPGQLTAVRVVLRKGASTSLTARFSPDVTGVGETRSPCEPVAWKLSVAPGGGGTVVVPVRPHTSVCSHGALQLDAFTAS